MAPIEHGAVAGVVTAHPVRRGPRRLGRKLVNLGQKDFGLAAHYSSSSANGSSCSTARSVIRIEQAAIPKGSTDVSEARPAVRATTSSRSMSATRPAPLSRELKAGKRAGFLAPGAVAGDLKQLHQVEIR